jgi:hypothetical protein
LLLAAGVDGALSVWEVTGKPKLELSSKDTGMSAVLDADWRDGCVFAVAGIDAPRADGETDADDDADKDKEKDKDKKGRKEKKVEEDPVDPTSVTKTFTSLWLYHASYSTPVLRIARAHQGDINTLRWCPQGYVLASGGEDGAVRLWRPILPLTSSLDAAVARMQQTSPPVPTDIDDLVEVPHLPIVVRPRAHGRHLWHTLLGHERGVTCVRFNDIGPSTLATAPTPSQMTVVNGSVTSTLPAAASGLLVASASLDTTARVWDVNAGACRAVLSRHVHPLTGLAWSGAEENAETNKVAPGHLLATYAHERVHVWDVAEAALVKTMRITAPGLDASWAGTQLAVGVADGAVIVMDAPL